MFNCICNFTLPFCTSFFLIVIFAACRKDNVGHYSSDNNSNSDNTDDVDTLCDGSQEDVSLSSDVSGHAIAEDKVENSEICIVKPAKFQNGVVRTNCIDCLDRTNVAQYAYGLAALGHQLHALDIIAVPEIDLDDPLAKYLMCFYERMGDTLAQQYGGSAAHNKVCMWNCINVSHPLISGGHTYFLHPICRHLNLLGHAIIVKIIVENGKLVMLCHWSNHSCSMIVDIL